MTPENIGSLSELLEFMKKILSFGFFDALAEAESIPAFLAQTALDWVFALIGLVLLAYLIYGGFLWLTSAGDPQRLQKAQDALVNALIGFGIVILSWTIVTIVMTLFGLRSPESTSSPDCPGQKKCELGGGDFVCVDLDAVCPI